MIIPDDTFYRQHWISMVSEGEFEYSYAGHQEFILGYGATIQDCKDAIDELIDNPTPEQHMWMGHEVKAI